MKKYIFYFICAFCLVLVLFVSYINVDAIIGAFGDGPPYYGRTTNMDKWENPIPLLAVVDILAIVIVGIAVRLAYKYLK
ncbi:MAG: hypothetical protein NWQ13_04340 [Glaciimonas sp.]|nr:hypothetical protein [Glaciimonas sp.]